MLLLNLLLALAWLLLTGQFTAINFMFGFVAAYLLLWLIARAWQADLGQAQRESYFGKVAHVLSFGLFFVWELILANLRVAIDVLRWRPKMEPAVVSIPLRDFSDAQLTMLANFVTLTPGTLSLDVKDGATSRDRMLIVHAMHAGRTQAEIDRFCSQLRQRYAERVRQVMDS